VADTFGDRTAYTGPIRLTELDKTLQQRQAARLVCAANAIGRTKGQRRTDLAELLAMLGLYPVDDPTSATGPTFPVAPFS
jgi:hypothetical protein